MAPTNALTALSSLRRSRWFLFVAAFAAAAVVVLAQPESSTPRWAFAGGRNARILSSPAVGPDHTVYVGVLNSNAADETGLLLAIRPDASNKWGNLPSGGFLVQRPGISSGIESSPALSPDSKTVYVGCDDGYLYAVNAADGTLKWAFPTGPNHSIFTSPAVGPDGTIFIGSSNLGTPEDSTFYAVSPDGKQVWFNSTDDLTEASPVIGANGTVYYASRKGTLYAAAYADGAEKWQFTLRGDVFASPAIGPDGTVYIGSDARELYALDPERGTTKWMFPASPGAGVSLGADGTIYLGSVETVTTGKIYALDRNGNLKAGWPVSYTGRILTIPAVRADGTVIFGCEDDTVRALNPDGTEKWSATLDDDVLSSPVIDTDGSIYVGSYGGRLYAFPGNGSPLSQYSAWPMFNRDIAHRSVASQTVVGGQLINLSARGPAGPGVNLIAGVIIEGPDLKRLLIRAVGPTLANYGVTNPLPNPSLKVHLNVSVPPFFNDDWGLDEDAAQIPRVASAVGAFPLPDGSKDAAKLVTAAQGFLYSTTVDSVDGKSGVAMAEIYDADPGNLTTHLLNLSARGTVGTGDNVLIAGLVIGGSGKLRVLVRGIGPGLIPYGVTGVLAQPTISVYRQADVIGTNTGWTSGGIKGDIAAMASLVGAFPLTSADSAIILTLDPGAYTCHVSGIGGATGEGMVEVYALPF